MHTAMVVEWRGMRMRVKERRHLDNGSVCEGSCDGMWVA